MAAVFSSSSSSSSSSSDVRLSQRTAALHPAAFAVAATTAAIKLTAAAAAADAVNSVADVTCKCTTCRLKCFVKARKHPEVISSAVQSNISATALQLLPLDAHQRSPMRWFPPYAVHAGTAERMVAAVYEDAQRSTASCAPLKDRMDAYKLAAESGHTAGRVTYAHLLLTGREVTATSAR
jgi:TPR repeat protein